MVMRKESGRTLMNHSGLIEDMLMYEQLAGRTEGAFYPWDEKRAFARAEALFCGDIPNKNRISENNRSYHYGN